MESLLPSLLSPDMIIDRLSLRDMQRVCDSIPMKSMDLGVGENGLHPLYHAILDYLAERGIVTSLTSNGLSAARLTDAELQRLHSVEFSLDFPTEREHDAFRGRQLAHGDGCAGTLREPRGLGDGDRCDDAH